MPIRVLQVVTNMDRGGLETMLMNYYRNIDREKVQFDFLVHRTERAAYDDEIEALGGIIYRLPKLVPWSRDYRQKLNQFFKEHPEYKIVHSHINCLSSIILKAAKDHNVPVRIAHSHNSRQDKNLTYPIKLYYRRFIPRYATKLLACGKAAGDWLFRGNPYEVLNNAIDTGKYLPDEVIRAAKREELGILENQYLIGHVGRFFEQKNHAFLLDIFAELCKLDADCSLLLIGDGPLRKQMEEKCVTLSISDRVIFTGVRSDVPELMQAMDCFVFPSLYEGLPVTMVEAQASGLPCYISDGVSSECILTDCVKQLSFTASAECWAKEILSQKGAMRCYTLQQIQAAGFDVKENAKYLERMYEEQYQTCLKN